MKTVKQRLSGLYLLLLVLMTGFGIPVSADEGMQVHFLNVGQADSTLITVDDHAMLIDAGNNDDEEPILNYLLNKQGISHLDYVIGTHPHEDHIGAMDSVLSSVSTDVVLLPDVTTSTQTFLDVLTAIDNQGLDITIPQPGETYSLGDASFTILGPLRDYGDNLNDWSIALKLIYGNTSFIFTGDAEYDAESDMIAAGPDFHADVYQVGHHGSRTSSSSALLDAVNPAWAVISCGSGNDYGHPHQETLEALANRNIQVLRTDLEGTIVAVSDGETISFDYGFSSREDSPQNQGEENFAPVSDDSITVSQSVDSDNTVVHITKTGEKYHSAGCQYLRKSDIEVTLAQAKERNLGPCSKCNPPK